MREGEREQERERKEGDSTARDGRRRRLAPNEKKMQCSPPCFPFSSSPSSSKKKQNQTTRSSRPLRPRTTTRRPPTRRAPPSPPLPPARRRCGCRFFSSTSCFFFLRESSMGRRFCLARKKCVCRSLLFSCTIPSRFHSRVTRGRIIPCGGSDGREN